MGVGSEIVGIVTEGVLAGLDGRTGNQYHARAYLRVRVSHDRTGLVREHRFESEFSRLTVYYKIFEPDILHLPVFVVAHNHRHLLSGAIVGHIPEGDILDATARSKTVFPIVEYPYVHKLSLAEILNPDILEKAVSDKVVIPCIYGYTALIINLFLFVIQDIYITVGSIPYERGRTLAVSIAAFFEVTDTST